MRVVVGEDHVLLREGLIRLLDAHGFDVVAAAGSGPSLQRALVSHRPDVAVVDIRLPPTHTDEGLRAATESRKEVPGLPILVLSQHVEPLYARELMSSGVAGIGYLLKDRITHVRQFIEALRRVAGGGTALDPEVVAQFMGRRTRRLDGLSARELEILALMAEGRTNTSIAEALVITEKTVVKHVGTVFRKLDLLPSPDDNRRVMAVLAFLDG